MEESEEETEREKKGGGGRLGDRWLPNGTVNENCPRNSAAGAFYTHTQYMYTWSPCSSTGERRSKHAVSWKKFSWRVMCVNVYEAQDASFCATISTTSHWTPTVPQLDWFSERLKEAHPKEAADGCNIDEPFIKEGDGEWDHIHPLSVRGSETVGKPVHTSTSLPPCQVGVCGRSAAYGYIRVQSKCWIIICTHLTVPRCCWMGL